MDITGFRSFSNNAIHVKLTQYYDESGTDLADKADNVFLYPLETLNYVYLLQSLINIAMKNLISCY